MSKYNELVTKLREIFQIDRPELDFGICRILNVRAGEINQYLEQRLPEKVKQALTAGSAAQQFFEREVLLQHAGGQGGVAEHETIAFAGEAEGHIEQLGVVQRLAHARAHGVPVVLGLHDRQGNVGLVKQRVVGAQHRAFVAVGLAAAHHDPPGAQGIFTEDLVLAAPSRVHHRGPDEFVADIAF